MKKFALLCVVIASAWGVMAQESFISEEEQEIALGAVTVTLPATWDALLGRDQAILFSNASFESLQDRTYSDGTVLFQANLIAPQLLVQANVPLDIPAEELLVLTSGDVPVEVTTVEIGESEFASAVLVEDDVTQELYVASFGDGAFAIISVVELSEGALETAREDINTLLTTLSINYAGDLPEAIFDYSALPQVTSEAGFPLLGSEDAPVKLVEISSFSCPFCATFHNEVLPGILGLVEAGDVSFSYVPFYRAGSVGDGRAASIAAMCADAQGAFWEYHDALFAWQSFGNFAYARPRLLDGAENLGLDMEAFTVCLDEEESAPALDAGDAYALEQDQFQGTPTLTLNGVIINSRPFETVEQAVRAALSAGN